MLAIAKGEYIASPRKREGPREIPPFARKPAPVGMTPLRVGGQHGQRYRIDGVWVVAQLDVERFSVGRRNRQRILHKTCRDGDRVSEICVRADRVKQEKFVAAESAFLFGVRYTMNSCQQRDAHQIDQRLPIALDALGCNRTKLQRSERRWAEEFHGIENSEQRFRILQREVAVLKSEQHAEGFIGGGNFNLFRGRKGFGHLRLEEENQSTILRQF